MRRTWIGLGLFVVGGLLGGCADVHTLGAQNFNVVIIQIDGVCGDGWIIKDAQVGQIRHRGLAMLF